MIIIHKGEEFHSKIDISDIDKIEKYKWYINNSGYVITKKWRDKGMMLHRYLLDVQDKTHLEVTVDHINRDRLDNRKCNLRLVDPTENSINRGIQSNNKSGIIGVSWDKHLNKWAVYIKYKYKHKFMGSSPDLEEAIRIRLQGELDVYGEEFAPQRHLFEKYNIHTRNPKVLETFFQNKHNYKRKSQTNILNTY